MPMALIGRKSGRVFRESVALLLVALYAAAVVHCLIPAFHAHHENETFCAFCTLILTPVLAHAARTAFLSFRSVVQTVARFRVFFHFLPTVFFFRRGPPLTA